MKIPPAKRAVPLLVIVVITERQVAGPHTVAQALRRGSFDHAVAQQATLAIAFLILIDQVCAGYSGVIQHAGLAPRERCRKKC